MKYSRFQDLPVWNDGVCLAVQVFELTLQSMFQGKGDLASQIQRAALSVSNNIAEGFERQTNRELLQFIYFAKGSVGEVLSMCAVMQRLHFLRDQREAIDRLETLCQSIARQLGAWAASQRDSEIEGSRYLNTREKDHREHSAQRDAFLTTIRRQTEEAAQQRQTQREQKIADSESANSGQGNGSATQRGTSS